MRFKEHYLKEENELVPVTNVATDNQSTDAEFMDKLKSLLNNKFALVGKYIKELTKPASKGNRKGLLIFKPEAAREIYQIKDDFVQFIVRDIYDHYRDIVNGVIWQIHMNQMFAGDFVKSLMKELNQTVNELEKEYEELKNFNVHTNPELNELTEKLKKYDKLYRKYDVNNVFNPNNPQSKPYFDAWNIFKTKVKKEHPRVPDDKLFSYIRKSYDYSREYDKLVEDFLNSIPEYVILNNKEKEIRRLGWDNEQKLRDKITEELKKLNYPVIKKQIETMVSKFVETIANSITQGTIN